MQPRIHATPLILALLFATPALAGCLDLGPGIDAALVDDAKSRVRGDPLVFERIHSPEEIAARVEAFATLDGVAVDVVGESVEGRPIHRVVLGEGPFVLWAVGRHHGNEPTGAEALLQIIPLLKDPSAAPGPDAPEILRALHEHRELVLARVTLVAVPVVNPDGAHRFVRTNVNGQDLNRDYFLFAEPETRAVRDAFWQHWPDACLDLHNKGWSDRFDYDAYSPEALSESEVQEALERAAWLAVHEVDASGGFAGGPNQNYRLGGEGVQRQVVNPTAVHPGTHDMFCSVRGAPGWTPEGAIVRNDDERSNHTYAWSTRLHAVTVASALLDAAGIYAGFETPHVHKVRGVLGELGADHLVDVPVRGDAWFQVVWRDEFLRAAPPPLSLDLNAQPVLVEVREPSGRAHVARLPAPHAYTATLRLPAAEAGTYRVDVKGPVGLEYEARIRVVPAATDAVSVERTSEGLLVLNEAPRALRVSLSDVVTSSRPLDPAAFGEAPRIVAWSGTLEERLGLGWDLDLAAGEGRRLAYPEDLENPGPWRWTAVDEFGRVASGVEGRRSTQ